MRSSSLAATMADGLAAAAAPAVRKGPWTVEEDHVLVDYVAGNREGSWNHLARVTGLHRTGKSCRLRWRNYLRPGLRRGKMTAEEQNLVVRLHSRWGNKWSKIAKHLPGRTDNDVKNFWKTNIRRRRQRDKVNIAAAGLCSGDTCITPVTTEAQAGSSSNNNSGGGSGMTTTGVDEAHQQPSMCRSVSVEEGHVDDQQVPGGAAGGTYWSPGCPAAMNFILPESSLLVPGENLWAIDDFWSTTQSCFPWQQLQL